MRYALIPLRGLGQILFQANFLSGTLVLAGLAVHSLTVAISALLGSVMGTAVAVLRGFPKARIDNGWYGFNAALVAIAVAQFLPHTLTSLLLALVAVPLSTFAAHRMLRTPLNPYTFPFVAITWLLFAVSPKGPAVPGSFNETLPALAQAAANSFGQVVFQSGILSGVLVFAAVLVNSRRQAFLALAASVLSAGAAMLLGLPPGFITAGLFGYNAVLAVIAVALITPSVAATLFAALLSVAITQIMLLAEMPALTFPFILANWITAAAIIRMQVGLTVAVGEN